MSKSVARIIFALVISLVIIAAIATTVQARLGSTSPGADLAAQNAVVGRVGANERSSSSLQQMEYFDSGQYYQDEGGGCNQSSSDD